MYESRLIDKFGANGVRGDLPSFKDYIESEAGQRELHAWQQRIHAQAKQDLSSHITQLAPGVNAALTWLNDRHRLDVNVRTCFTSVYGHAFLSCTHKHSV